MGFGLWRWERNGICESGAANVSKNLLAGETNELGGFIVPDEFASAIENMPPEGLRGPTLQMVRKSLWQRIVGVPAMYGDYYGRLSGVLPWYKAVAIAISWTWQMWRSPFRWERK